MSIGIALLSSGLATLNQYIERDLDRLMRRTQARPLPTGKLLPAEAAFLRVLIRSSKEFVERRTGREWKILVGQLRFRVLHFHAHADHRRFHLRGDIGKADRVRRSMRIDFGGNGGMHAGRNRQRHNGGDRRRQNPCGAEQPIRRRGASRLGTGLGTANHGLSSIGRGIQGFPGQSCRHPSHDETIATLVVNVSRSRMVPPGVADPRAPPGQFPTDGTARPLPAQIRCNNARIRRMTRTSPISPLGP